MATGKESPGLQEVPAIASTSASEPAPGAAQASASQLPVVVVDRARALTVREPPAWRRWLLRLRFVPLVWVLLATGGIIGMYFQPPGLQAFFRFFGLTPGGGTSRPIAVPAPQAPPPDAAPRQRSVVGLGKLVPKGELVVVAPPFGAGDARIAELKVAEGQRVARGQLLAVFDNEPSLRAALESAKATIAAREAAIAQTLANVRASRDEAQAALERAEATARNAQLEFERIEPLRQKGYASEATYQQRRTARDEAQREVQKAKANLSRWTALDPREQPDVVVAVRNLEAAKAELARAERDLDKSRAVAPIDGTVLTIQVRPGEKPGTLGLMNIGNIDQMTAEVEIYQNQIGLVAVGDKVQVTAEALPRPLEGRVARIGLEVGRQVLTDANPAANTDARIVKVYVDLDQAASEVARRFTSLQVVARIAVGQQP